MFIYIVLGVVAIGVVFWLADAHRADMDQRAWVLQTDALKAQYLKRQTDAVALTRAECQEAMAPAPSPSTMSQEQLDAGADAVAKTAAKDGVGRWIHRDQEREIAAVVIRSYLARDVPPEIVKKNLLPVPPPVLVVPPPPVPLPRPFPEAKKSDKIKFRPKTKTNCVPVWDVVRQREIKSCQQ